MPQLDKVTYFSQFFWLVIFFISIFFLVSNILLPNVFKVIWLRLKITRSLLIRQKAFDSLFFNKTNSLRVFGIGNYKSLVYQDAYLFSNSLNKLFFSGSLVALVNTFKDSYYKKVSHISLHESTLYLTALLKRYRLIINNW